MAENTLYSINDGAQYTVSDLMANPISIAKPIVNYLTDWDLTSALFRNAGPNNGSALYEKDSAPFAAEGLETVAEFAEIPRTRTVGGTKVMVTAEKEARGLDISYDMRDENQTGQVSKMLQQFQNSALLSSTKRIKAVLETAEIPTVAAAQPWIGGTPDVVPDLFDAIEQISEAEVPGFSAEEATWDFEPTAIIMPRAAAGAFVMDDKLKSMYTGDIASENPLYKGFTGMQFNGLSIVFPKFWYKDRILVTSGQELGFVSDTRPLAMTGPYDEPMNEFVSYKLVRKRIIAVDTPKSACWITGVKAA